MPFSYFVVQVSDILSTEHNSTVVTDNGDGHRPTEGPPKPCGAQIFQPFGNSRDFCASPLPSLQPRGANIHSPKQGSTSSRCTVKIPRRARSLWSIMYFLSLLPSIVVRIAEIRAMCRIIMFVLCTTQTFDHNINSYRKCMYYSTDTSVLSFYKTCGKKRTQRAFIWFSASLGGYCCD